MFKRIHAANSAGGMFINMRFAMGMSMGCAQIAAPIQSVGIPPEVGIALQLLVMPSGTILPSLSSVQAVDGGTMPVAP